MRSPRGSPRRGAAGVRGCRGATRAAGRVESSAQHANSPASHTAWIAGDSLSPSVCVPAAKDSADGARHGRPAVSAAGRGTNRHDGPMANVEILLVGGPDDGDSVVVELDPSGRPPLTFTSGGDGLADATVYEIRQSPSRGLDAPAGAARSRR